MQICMCVYNANVCGCGSESKFTAVQCKKKNVLVHASLNVVACIHFPLIDTLCVCMVCVCGVVCVWCVHGVCMYVVCVWYVCMVCVCVVWCGVCMYV